MSTLSRPFLIFFLITGIVCSIYLVFSRDTSDMCQGITSNAPLIVKSGSVITLEAGEEYEYSSVLIHKGGVLEIVGKSPEWTTIKSRGNFRLEGTIRSKGYDQERPNSLVYLARVELNDMLDSIAHLRNDSSKSFKLNNLDTAQIVQVTGSTIRGKTLTVSRDEKFSRFIGGDTIVNKKFFLTYWSGAYRDKSDDCNCQVKRHLGDSLIIRKVSLKELEKEKLFFDILTPSSPTYKFHDDKIDLGFSYTYGKDTKGGKGGAGGRLEECKRKSCVKHSCFDGKPGTVSRGGNGRRGMSVCDIADCKSEGNCHWCKDKECRECEKCEGECRKCIEDSPCKECTYEDIPPGKGGDGGVKGKDGGLLYIASCGNFIGENGTIDVSGSKGGKGKDGESKKYTGGGGGGGGPGGNGGMIYFNVCGQLSLPTTLIAGGPGGDGGKGGTAHKKDGLVQFKGEDGKRGQSGSPGKLEIDQSCEERDLSAKDRHYSAS